jgi:AraC family transcriptional regulator
VPAATSVRPLTPCIAAAAADANLREQRAWAQIRGEWRQLHGSFAGQGISVEWHDFRIEQDMDWGRSFHPGSLEVCLNFSGAGTLQDGDAERTLGPNQVAVYTLQNRRLRAVRRANSLHRFLTVELSPGFLRTHFGVELESLKPAVRRFIELGAQAPAYLDIRPLPAALLASRLQFVKPPVAGPARRSWYLGRVLEILSQTLFPEEDPKELFCHKHQRTNRERIERVRYLIERDLENPPSLDMLAEEVACSPFYLSRVFAQETGASIPKFLRMKRMEKAAELLRTGRMNVTEAAMAVGYASLSAFSKAFVEHFGCCPGLYPHFKIPGRGA